MLQISDNNEYSLFSFIKRTDLLKLSEVLDVFSNSKSLFSNLRIDINEKKVDRDELYKDLDKLIYLNFVAIETFKLLSRDLYDLYKIEYPVGSIESFVNYKFGSFINEINLFNKLLREEQCDDWYQKENTHFYRYAYREPKIGFGFYIWKSKSADDIHFYTEYFEEILTFFKDEIFSFLTNKNIDPVDPVDLSDSSGVEKIIYLKELGILDFLRSKEPFNTSTNALANIVSGITGIPQTTAQSSLNPMFSKGVDQRNNPMETKETLNKVIQKLISIGFNPSK